MDVLVILVDIICSLVEEVVLKAMQDTMVMVEDGNQDLVG